MLRPILYYTLASPPSRSTLLAAAAIGLDVDIRDVNLAKGEHLKPEFIKMNPQHTVPTLDDNGEIIWDSHAINSYFVRKYAKNDNLYPRDINVTAKIDQYMYFESGTLFYAAAAIFFVGNAKDFYQVKNVCIKKQAQKPVLNKGEKDIARSELYLLKDAYTKLDKMLEGKKWLVGDSYTLADISNVCTLTTLALLEPLDKYSNIKNWVKRCEENLPGYKQWNLPGLEKLQQLLHSSIKLN